MIPRTCGGDRCDTTGWVHDPQCTATATDADAGDTDWRQATDLEDGVAGRRTVPAQQRRAA